VLATVFGDNLKFARCDTGSAFVLALNFEDVASVASGVSDLE